MELSELIIELNVILSDTATGPLSDTPYVDTSVNGDHQLELWEDDSDSWPSGTIDTPQLARAVIEFLGERHDPGMPDAATEEAFKKAEAFDKAVALSERRQTLLEEAEAERDAALARIAAAAELHRKRKHWKSDREYVFACEECTRINRYGIAHWPCPTAVALGLNDGENNE